MQPDRSTVIDRSEWIWRGLATATLLATALRLLASIVAGLVDIGAHHDDGYYARIRAADILTSFGAAGDAESALLGVVALALIVVVARSTADPDWVLRRLSSLRLLMVTTALLAICVAVGNTLFAADSFDQPATTSRWLYYVIVAVAAIIFALAVSIAARRFADTLVFDRDGDWVVFALDRHTKDVRAFLSQSEALRRLPWASLEDDEYELMRDDGRVLTVEFSPQPRFVETDQSKSAELSAALRDYAERNELFIRADGTPEPLDYALPLHARQWLDLWPHWMRPIGMLVRKFQSL
jgi:hypothetical protein